MSDVKSLVLFGADCHLPRVRVRIGLRIGPCEALDPWVVHALRSNKASTCDRILHQCLTLNPALARPLP